MIVQAGRSITSNDITSTASDIAMSLRNFMTSASRFKTFLDDNTTDQDFIDLGLTQEQVDALRAAFITELGPIITAFDAMVEFKKIYHVSV